MVNCILKVGCVYADSCGLICQAKTTDLEAHGLRDCFSKGKELSQLIMDHGEKTLGVDSCRNIARNAADAYRIITELGGARHLRDAAKNRCIEIMDTCEWVTDEMDGRPGQMILDSTTTYRCDGCGFKKDNPTGWNYMSPMVLNEKVDFRSGIEHYCNGCTTRMKNLVKHES